MAADSTSPTQPVAAAPPANSGGQTASATEEAPTKLTPALLREVAQKVYALWLHDMQIERERLGIRSNDQPARGRIR